MDGRSSAIRKETVSIADTSSSSSAIGAVSAGTRALAQQFMTFYLRVPLKLFRPARVDYLMTAKALSTDFNSKPWGLLTHSSVALLYRSVQKYGWQFIPNQVLPPIVANSAVGLVLYTTYLTSVHFLRDSESHKISVMGLLQAGAVAGFAQSLVCAPLDAIRARFSVNELLASKHSSMWAYSGQKLKDIGPGGVFTGYSLSLVKESAGFALFFTAFEIIKGPAFSAYCYVRRYGQDGPPRYVFPAFVIVAGGAATLALQVVAYPLGKVQQIFHVRMEVVQIMESHKQPTASRWSRSLSFIGSHFDAYKQTFHQINRLQMKNGKGWLQWLYKGYWRHCLASMPSTSMGLIIFELMRQGEIAFNKEDVEVR